MHCSFIFVGYTRIHVHDIVVFPNIRLILQDATAHCLESSGNTPTCRSSPHAGMIDPMYDKAVTLHLDYKLIADELHNWADA